ncbi:UNVERIFIED_CONTAM: hypothetical protein K2H54_055991, partial [Gekko kuhli]
MAVNGKKKDGQSTFTTTGDVASVSGQQATAQQGGEGAKGGQLELYKGPPSQE